MVLPMAAHLRIMACLFSRKLYDNWERERIITIGMKIDLIGSSQWLDGFSWNRDLSTISPLNEKKIRAYGVVAS
jgi:hypothetical protein